MEYFEVLRHFKVSARLVDVRECLFVPLLLSPFDNLKALRWRTVLGPNLLDRSLLKAFDAIERIANDYLTEDFPVKRFADDQILQMKGTLSVSFKAVRPNDNPDGSFNKANWLAIEQLIGIDAREFFDNFLGDSSNRDDIFQARLTDDLAKAWFDSLQIIAVDEFDREHILAFDTTVLSNRRIRGNATIALKLSGPIRLNRASIRQVKVRSKLAGDPRFQRLMQQLQDDFRLILKSGNISYKTQHFDGKLFAEKSINDDIAAGDDATVSTPLTAEELRDPKEEDRCLSNRILSHLNEQLEYYHRAIWLQMDPQRRFMLLDGIFAPNSGGRSVASVVENRLIGIVGNCMIFPVTPGIHLDPTYSIDPIDPISLLGVYSSENEAILRVSLPSKGVFAEAVLGSCNSCEKKDESRFWRWEESPIPDSPTQINDISTQSRATAAPDLQGKELPATIINMQNAPAAPEPSGFSSLVQALSNANTFRDISGLTANQQSALAATQSTLQAAKAFGSGAVESAIQNNAVKNIDKVKNTLDDALKSGMITKEQASKALLNAVKSFSGNGDDSGHITGQNVVAAANQVMKDGGSLTFSSPEQEFELTTGLADSLGPPATAGSTAIFLKKPASDTAPERAFFPNDPINSKTGKVEFRAVASGVPKGGKIVWSIGTRKAGQTGNVDFGTKGTTSATGSKVTIRAVEPGLVDIDCKVVASGKTLASVKIPIAVPLFVQITEDKVKSKFEDFLAEYPTPDSNILALKDLFLENTKAVAEHIMRTANARLIWQVGPFNEEVPDFVTSFSTVAIKNRHDPIDVGGELVQDQFVGLTPGGCVKANFIRAVEMYPGTLKHFDGGSSADDRDILIMFRELMLEFENSIYNDPDKITNAAILMGRLLGAALAHEVGHVLSPECFDYVDAVGGRVQFSGHSRILNDIMYPGGPLDLELQTGWKVAPISLVDFPATGTFEDNLLAPITTFIKTTTEEPVILLTGDTAVNCFQKEGSLNLIEKNFPIPPNLPPIIK